MLSQPNKVIVTSLIFIADPFLSVLFQPMRSARRPSNITLAEGFKLILRKIRKFKPVERYLFVANPDLMVKKQLGQLATIDQSYWRPGRRLRFLDCPGREAARCNEKPGL